MRVKNVLTGAVGESLGVVSVAHQIFVVALPDAGIAAHWPFELVCRADEKEVSRERTEQSSNGAGGTGTTGSRSNGVGAGPGPKTRAGKKA